MSFFLVLNNIHLPGCTIGYLSLLKNILISSEVFAIMNKHPAVNILVQVIFCVDIHFFSSFG